MITRVIFDSSRWQIRREYYFLAAYNTTDYFAAAADMSRYSTAVNTLRCSATVNKTRYSAAVADASRYVAANLAHYPAAIADKILYFSMETKMLCSFETVSCSRYLYLRRSTAFFYHRRLPQTIRFPAESNSLPILRPRRSPSHLFPLATFPGGHASTAGDTGNFSVLNFSRSFS